jgi:hypothetical protein
MSMLTPLGTGGRSRKKRRWPRILLVLAVLALVVGGVYAVWQWLPENEPASPTAAAPSEVCRTPTIKSPKALPQPAEIEVDVANGTDRAGLAVQTADALAERGFSVGDIGNTDKPIKAGVALVRYQPDSLDAAIMIAAYVPGAQLQPDDKTSVPELWLGPDFTNARQGIASTDDVDPGTVVLPTLDPICRTPRS